MTIQRLAIFAVSLLLSSATIAITASQPLAAPALGQTASYA